MSGQKVKEHKVIDCKGCEKEGNPVVSYDLYYHDSCPVCKAEPEK